MSGYLYRYSNGEFYGYASASQEAEWKASPKDFMLVDDYWGPDKTLKMVWYPERLERIPLRAKNSK